MRCAVTRRSVFKIATPLVSACLALAVAECCLRLFMPLPYLVPVSDWNPEYGPIHYPSARIVNARPGHYHYVYTTNPLRYRGMLVDPNSPVPKIVLLGDSNIFGFGLQDDETISERINHYYAGSKQAVNLGNGGWSLGQEVRRYLELGETFQPITVVLYFASNDLRDLRYGIHWVAYPDETGRIRLRDAPTNPAGRIRKILPPDGFVYSVLMRRQLVLRVKVLLNQILTGASAASARTTEVARKAPAAAAEIQSEQVIVSDVAENERRYAVLLDAFARHLQRQDVRFLFMTDDASCYGSELLSEKVAQLDAEGLLQWLPISRWFAVGEDLPPSPQGHHFGKAAADRLARSIIRVVENGND